MWEAPDSGLWHLMTHKTLIERLQEEGLTVTFKGCHRHVPREAEEFVERNEQQYACLNLPWELLKGQQGLIYFLGKGVSLRRFLC